MWQGTAGDMRTPPPTFRLSVLDAAADYIEADMNEAAARTLQRLLGSEGSDGVPEWLQRLETGDNAPEVAVELRAEVVRLRGEA